VSEKAAAAGPKPVLTAGGETFWEDVHAIAAAFQSGLDGDPRDAANALLNLDRLIWQAQQKAENPEFISQAREILRESVVLLGTRLASAPRSKGECLAPLVEELLALRDSFREKKQWQEADAVRDCLRHVNIEVDDTSGGHQWRLHS
jgi:cysteinyl-tRNA synthetase